MSIKIKTVKILTCIGFLISLFHKESLKLEKSKSN